MPAKSGLESAEVEGLFERAVRPIVVDLSAIRGVSVQRRHWLQGTLWGLGGGILAGSVFGMMVDSFYCTTVDGCSSSERQGAIRWGAVLGVVGGGMLLIDPETPAVWRLVDQIAPRGAEVESTSGTGLPWLAEMMDIKKEANFFEQRVTEYRKSSALIVGDDDDL